MAEKEVHTTLFKAGPKPWWKKLFQILWQITAFLGAVVLLGLVVGVASTWLTSSNGVIPANSPVGKLLAQWPITLLVGCCLLLMALLINLLSRWPTQEAASSDEQTRSPRQAIEQQNSLTRRVPLLSHADYRKHLRKQVREFIEQMLANSLYTEAHIDTELYFKEKPDALEKPMQHLYRELNRRPWPLLPETSIDQVYGDADGDLLILGEEPGAGKTTLLLKLARILLEQAEHDEQECTPIPAIFNLSSWEQKRQLLWEQKRQLLFEDWLVEELCKQYQIPREVGKDWIDTNQILPLLDGLDEVAENARKACVQEIMAYRQRHLEQQRPVPVVICCRKEDYEPLPHVQLRKAVSIQLLTDEQIEDHLQKAKGQLEGLRQALCDDPELYKLARTPLMLGVLTLAYRNVPSVDLAAEETPEAKERQIWATYVDQMLDRRGDPYYAKGRTKNWQQQTKDWLARLATRMKGKNSFYLEDMQPTDWLDPRWGYRMLYRAVAGFLIGFVAPWPTLLMSILLLGVSKGISGLGINSLFAVVLVLVGLVGFCLMTGLLGGVIAGLLFWWKPRIKFVGLEGKTQWSWEELKDKTVGSQAQHYRLRIGVSIHAFFSRNAAAASWNVSCNQ